MDKGLEQLLQQAPEFAGGDEVSGAEELKRFLG